MYKLPLIFSLLSIFPTGAFGVTMPGPSTAKQNDPSIIEGADAYVKAVVAGDARSVAAMFDDDAILMPPHQKSLRGRPAIQQFYEGWCHSPMKPAAFSFDHLEATVSGDSAYDVGTYKMSISTESGRSLDDTGKYTAILKRSAGEWKIAYLIFNSDLLPQPPAVTAGK
jgi:uncharacterized protein (TIGR02246 family)